MTHTKKPWYMNMYYHEDKSRHYGIFATGKQKAHLAEPTSQALDWASEQEVNARLIASSPIMYEALSKIANADEEELLWRREKMKELLEACKIIVSLITGGSKYPEYWPNVEKHPESETLKRVEQAISKAERRK